MARNAGGKQAGKRGHLKAPQPPFDRVRGKGLRRRRRTGEAWAVQAFPPRFLLPGHQAVLGVPFRRAGLRMVTPAGPRSAIDGRTRRQPYFSEAGWISYPLRGHRACADTMEPCHAWRLSYNAMRASRDSAKRRAGRRIAAPCSLVRFMAARHRQ